MSDHSTSAPSGDRKGVWRVFVNLLAALGVLLIGASAMALSYFAFYDRTVEAGVEDPFTYLYLGEFALLLLLAFMASYILRRGKRLHRVSVELLIVLLIATGLLAVVEDMLPVTMDARTEDILFAAVPWVGLLLGAMIARWIDIELRVRRAAEPTPTPATVPATAQPAPSVERSEESGPDATHDASRNGTSDSDIGWLTNKMRPGNGTDEDAAQPDAQAPTEPLEASPAATKGNTESAPASSVTRETPRTRRNGAVRTRGRTKTKKRTDDTPEEPVAADGDDDRATATTTPMAPVGTEPPTEPLETAPARDESTSDAADSEPDAGSRQEAEAATTAVEATGKRTEDDDGVDSTSKAESGGAVPTTEPPRDDPAEDEAAAAKRRAKEQAARRLAEEVANAPDDTAGPTQDSGPTATRPQTPTDDSDGETGESAAQAGALPPLPRRTPGETAHQPRRLSPVPAPEASTAERSSAENAVAPAPSRGESVDDVTQGLLALVDPPEEGFVPDPPYDDPTTDEGTVGENNAMVPVDDVPPPATSSPTGADEEPDAPAPTDDSPTDSEESSSVELPSRPLVRRPRRGNVADFPPAQPPSGQVRSGPTPP
ncbi:hypothetical protein J4H86_18230 [Spiractinospora alimapuensis]|uniref:hypothetical protein n=1 Tax=Spiractinospora alimapuensis TaxID=2820884 RepID=UPI001F2D6152|nr:hypothetical protein [Spiractinospora alimapuensis]QVQ50798.1 hypothetical protein J4H86_18230 [Spiractinospora alimapuensis]